jgi:hypothetical protein
MAEMNNTRRRSWRDFLDITVACTAVIVSLASLWVALRTDRTQEALLKSSVWPYVLYDTSDATDTGTPRLAYDVINQGVGPAIVRSFALAYDGKYVGSLRELMALCCQARPLTGIFASTVADRVIQAHETVTFIQGFPDRADLKTYEMLSAARKHVTIRMCYCSVLGECWELDASVFAGTPVPVHVCPPAQQPQYTT